MSAAKAVRKVFVPDTSVLIHDPETIFNFEDNFVIIPFVALEELDKKKNGSDSDVAASARKAIRNLESLFSLGKPSRGIPMPNGGVIFVDDNTYVPKGVPRLDMSLNDNRIIGVALRWQHRKEAAFKNAAARKFFSSIAERYDIGETVLISKDINLRAKALACDLEVEDYQKDRLVASEADLYTGIVRIPAQDEELDALQAMFYEEGDNKGLGGKILSCNRVSDLINLPQLLPNACCIFHGSREVLGLYSMPEKRGEMPYFRLIEIPTVPNGGGRKIRPRNVGQGFAYQMLSDQRISLVALSGIAGSGKTLMALAAGLEQVKPERGKGWYDQIIVCRPTQELGNPIGYLKGTLADKMSPWARPIVDALQLISNGREQEAYETETKKQFTLEELLNDSTASPVKVEPSNFMQGRSLHHKILILDEVQNYRPGDVKKLITRAGKGSKVVLVGDVEQVESPYLDAVSNGLSYVIERMKGQPTFGHVTLWQSERSPLAELAAKLL